MDVLHHDTDVQVYHPVDSPSFGVDQVAADVGTCTCMQDVELACLLQDLGSSVAQSLGRAGR